MRPTIVLTRPEGSQGALADRLTSEGWPVLVQPVIAIAPLDTLPEIPELGSDDVCLYVSSNAVSYGLPILAASNAVSGIRHLAVGERTAQALAEHGIEAITPERADSEGLLSLPALQTVQGRKVLIVKGEGGRGLLADVLSQRGADVHDLPCYRRQPADVDCEQLCERLASPSALVFQAASGETLEYLSDLIARCGQPTLWQQPVVVPSARVAELAAERGWHRVVQAENAGDAAFIDALAALHTGDTVEVVAPRSEQIDLKTGDTPMSDASSSQSPSAPVSAQPARRADGLARFFALLAILLLAGAAAAGWTLLWPQWQTQVATASELRQQLSQIDAERDQLATQLSQQVETQLAQTAAQSSTALDARLAQAAAARTELDAEAQQLRARVDRLDIKLARLTATDRRAWLSNEAAFLVRLAAQRLMATRDVAVAQALLNNADALLAEADDPRLESARRAIAADRTALAAAPRVDSVGLYARFAALVGQAAALQVDVSPPNVSPQTTEHADWLDSAKAGWRAALAKLSNYLVVRRRDAEMARMMNPDWEALARQNLRMLLEQGQIAAMSANQPLYDTALARAKVFAQEFAGSDPTRVAAITEELDALAALTIAPELPDLLASRSALADAIRQLDGDVVEQAAEPSAVTD